jgi:hypothetical protein
MSLERFQIKGAPTCRVVYPDGLFEKKSVAGVEDSEPKYNAFIIVPKNDEIKMKQITEESDKAFAELRGKGFTGKTIKAINPKNYCVVDGDAYADEKEGREAFRGYVIIKVSSKNFRPIVCDRFKNVITNGHLIPGLSVEKMSDEELFDGDYVLANISFWTYSQKTFQGIGCNVHAIVKMADGEAIGGVSKNVDDYIEIADYE